MLARNLLRCTAHITKRESGDFPSGPTVKTLPSNRGSVDLIPGRGIKIPHLFKDGYTPQFALRLQNLTSGGAWGIPSFLT